MFFAPKEMEERIQTESTLSVGGLLLDSHAYFPPLIPWKLFVNMIHEGGHVIGDNFSGRKGEILSLEEIRHTTIFFSFEEYVRLAFLFIQLRPTRTIPNEFIPIIRRLLEFYTKGNFDGYAMQFTLLTEKDFRDLVRKHRHQLETITTTQDGSMKFKSSKLGRDEELSAITAEDYCLKMFMQDAPTFLKLAGIFAMMFQIYSGNLVIHQSSYGRARKIVRRAFKSRGWILPSTKDLAQD